MLSKYKWYFFPLLLLLFFFSTKINNSCRSYSGYYNLFSSDCFHNPDLQDDIFGIIQRHIGFSEFHEVETEDGHILGLFRIPRENPKGVVLLEHPISHDSRIWLAQQNQSIAFLFWRAGYDVWLSNSRGTLHSRKHKTLTIDSPKFWNYSLHELGYYDSHATINFIRRKTNGSKIINLGLSMGATKILIYASTRPEDAAESIKTGIVIAAGSHLNKATSILRHIIPSFFKLQDRFNFIDIHSNIARIDSWYMGLIRTMSRFFPLKKSFAYLGSALYGWAPDEFDPKFADSFIEALGLEISFKTLHHFSQIYSSGGIFQMYDHGEEENFSKYGQKTPLLYDLDKIKFPVVVVYGEKDTLSYPEDNEMLFKSLPKEVRRFGKFQVKGFNHMDFVFGKRFTGFYKNILQLLDRIKC